MSSMNTEVTISMVDNGFVVTGHALEGGDGTYQVFEASDEDVYGFVEALQRALWQAIDLLGMSGSRYDAKRIRVVVEPGDKWQATSLYLTTKPDDELIHLPAPDDSEGGKGP